MIDGGPARTYSYDRFNRLVQVLQGGSNVMSLEYDAAGRLARTTAGAAPTNATTSQYLYDGDQAIVELTGLGAIRRRFVPGPGLDNIIVQIDHDGGGVPERRWILSDDLGSVAALTDRTGKAIRFNAYGPFGEPSAGNIGRMGWAGALTLPEIGMVHLRARTYAPNLGRFIQPDPIGTAGGINLYAYADGDPVNNIDPLGLMSESGSVCQPLDGKCFEGGAQWTGGPLFWRGFGADVTQLPSVTVWGRRSGSNQEAAEQEDRLERQRSLLSGFASALAAPYVADAFCLAGTQECDLVEFGIAAASLSPIGLRAKAAAHSANVASAAIRQIWNPRRG